MPIILVDSMVAGDEDGATEAECRTPFGSSSITITIAAAPRRSTRPPRYRLGSQTGGMTSNLTSGVRGMGALSALGAAALLGLLALRELTTGCCTATR